MRILPGKAGTPIFGKPVELGSGYSLRCQPRGTLLENDISGRSPGTASCRFERTELIANCALAWRSPGG